MKTLFKLVFKTFVLIVLLFVGSIVAYTITWEPNFHHYDPHILEVNTTEVHVLNP